ncbi:hypothetical protein M0Q97_01485 [Candidatus Dojkabacteria bacterium]|jgi:hypothetical protein|nr:hypothetical protein [Candidatus Dojkabacteria bacterium]
MTVFDYIIENKILNKKEFIDLHSVRSIKVDNKYLFDPNISINNIKTIMIGALLINIK